MVTTRLMISHKLRMARNYLTLNNIIRYRVILFLVLGIIIVGFSVFGLSNEEIAPRNGNMPEPAGTTIKSTNAKILEQNPDYITDFPTIENLIILPCHSIFAPELNPKGSDYDNNRFGIGMDPNNWLLKPFQIESNDQDSFLKHIELSLFELHENIKNSALVISGGFTQSAIEKSESSSYLELAQTVGFLKSPYFRPGTNILLEEYARDSYENVLYSICTFVKRFNKFPKKITVVGFSFKRERFLALHLATLGYYTIPSVETDISKNNLPDTNHAKYVSAGPFVPEMNPGMTEQEYETFKINFWKSLNAEEKKNAFNPFKENPFGSKNSIISDKKLKRDPWEKHGEVSSVYNMNNEILDTLISIDNYDLKDAWNLYQKKVLPYFPLYEQDYAAT